MPKNLVNTKDLVDSRVWFERPKKDDPEATKKVGRVRACVFHPKEKRCVGFIVKRPDLVLMFRRGDLFVAYNGFDLIDGEILVRNNPEATDKKACKALGINLDECVLWVGLPVMCQDGTEFGLVRSVLFDAETGLIDSLEISQGATANVLLGRRRVPATLIRGFRRGMGAQLADINGSSAEEQEGEDACGAILVDDSVKNSTTEGGLADAAGKATAIAGHQVRKVIKKAKPAASEAASVLGEAANKGAYLTGRQIARASGMFAAFKEEYDKARHG